jgi:hypothetical protein
VCSSDLQQSQQAQANDKPAKQKPAIAWGGRT